MTARNFRLGVDLTCSKAFSTRNGIVYDVYSNVSHEEALNDRYDESSDKRI